MRFRPCIDIHNGKVKQIVGGTLTDKNNWAKENFVSDQNAEFFSNKYRQDGLLGGHIILLNKEGTSYYEEDVLQAKRALGAYKNGMQIGGGIHAKNAEYFLEAGASHVIVTSYVFQEGIINYENLEKLVKAVGKSHIVLDLSCRKKSGEYYVVTNRWQTFTKEKITEELLNELSLYCDEFLIHAVDVEGKTSGIEKELVIRLGNWAKIPITYAGGIGTMKDIEELYYLGNNNLDVTIGSALDLFGGTLSYEKIRSLLSFKA